MKLSILHSTSYTYDEPVNGLIQSLKLIPSIHEGQKIIEWDIKSSIKGIFGSSYKDGAGDIVQTFSTEEKVKTLDIITKGIVETNNQYGILKDYEEEINPNVYLRNTKLTKPNSEIIKFSKQKKLINIRLNTQEENKHAKSLYLNNGFKPVKTNFLILSTSNSK